MGLQPGTRVDAEVGGQLRAGRGARQRAVPVQGSWRAACRQAWHGEAKREGTHCHRICCPPRPPSSLQVVVVAEDGVSTSRYPIQFTLVESAKTLAVAEAEGSANLTAAGLPGRGEAGLRWRLQLQLHSCSITGAVSVSADSSTWQ